MFTLASGSSGGGLDVGVLVRAALHPAAGQVAPERESSSASLGFFILGGTLRRVPPPSARYGEVTSPSRASPLHSSVSLAEP